MQAMGCSTAAASRRQGQGGSPGWGTAEEKQGRALRGSCFVTIISQLKASVEAELVVLANRCNSQQARNCDARNSALIQAQLA